MTDLVGVGVDLAQRRLRVEPLRVLLVAVEDEGRADEALVDQRLGVLHAGAVAEGEAELRLEPLAARQIGRAQRLAEVVGDRLLAQDVLARLQRGPGELEVGVARA